MNDISNIRNIDQSGYISGSAGTRGVDAKNGQTADRKTEISQNDKVSLSRESKGIQHAESAANAAPDIRTEIVNPIKQAVADGTYNVNAEEVAESMIGSTISEVI